jgi:hypothetical protein
MRLGVAVIVEAVEPAKIEVMVVKDWGTCTMTVPNSLTALGIATVAVVKAEPGYNELSVVKRAGT